MKKYLTLIIVFLFCLTLCACAAESKVESKAPITKESVAGKYESIGLEDPLSVYTDFLLSSQGKPITRESLSLGISDLKLIFEDSMFKGTCELNGQTLLLKREEIVESYPSKTIAQTIMARHQLKFLLFLINT